jgi:hypothetical protein
VNSSSRIYLNGFDSLQSLAADATALNGTIVCAKFRSPAGESIASWQCNDILNHDL